MRSWFMGLCFVLWAMPAMAITAKPPEIATVIASEKPYGEARLRKLGFHVYDASLWHDGDTWQIDSLYALTLTYAMNFTPQELAERSIEEMRRTTAISDAVETSRYTRLIKLFPTVKPGDRITALYQPPGNVSFFHNGTPTGSIAEPDFARAFMGIWLSDKTSEPVMRSRLIRQP